MELLSVAAIARDRTVLTKAAYHGLNVVLIEGFMFLNS